MRSILVLADRRPESENRLQAALSLARANSGHLTVLIDTPVARYLMTDAMGSGYLAADIVREAVSGDDAFAEALNKRLLNEDVPYDILRAEDEPADAIAEAARLNDVVVLSRGQPFVGEVVLRGATPVLVLPREGATLLPPSVVCVAWDGGDEAASALRLAVPLLVQAERVHVLTVAEKSGGFPVCDAVKYLARHGVKAEVVEVERAASIAVTLDATLAELQADLLVMGAYGHSRLREFLLGGVTRYFLEDSAGPTLLLAN
ncbi:universal stress protein [Novosphingobium rosa]|uniref:universal stress protein n=1 Tax=Novosphingobium rosa TaxID=76978 RepID=UPI0008316A3A|nr:universal stress protein [Novosphingobium rosa]